MKRERDDDNDVGLSLDADESPSITTVKSGTAAASLGDERSPTADAPHLAPLAAEDIGKDKKDDGGTLKRAYDDALAARGLMSVSRSCEKLTDLALPAKLQRTLSQEYLRQQQVLPNHHGRHAYSVSSVDPAKSEGAPPARQQSPGQHPSQNQLKITTGTDKKDYPSAVAARSNPSATNTSVEVPSATMCALCHDTNVDTQLRPCGHMFHETCLKPSLQTAMRQPKCPIDHIPMQSALLAVPTEDVSTE